MLIWNTFKKKNFLFVCRCRAVRNWNNAEGLKKYFAIDFLIISGGGIVNWSFLQEGYIDELSLVICPLSDGRTDTATLFDRSSYAAWDITVAFFPLKK